MIIMFVNVAWHLYYWFTFSWKEKQLHRVFVDFWQISEQFCQRYRKQIKKKTTLIDCDFSIRPNYRWLNNVCPPFFEGDQPNWTFHRSHIWESNSCYVKSRICLPFLNTCEHPRLSLGSCWSVFSFLCCVLYPADRRFFNSTLILFTHCLMNIHVPLLFNTLCCL